MTDNLVINLESLMRNRLNDLGFALSNAKANVSRLSSILNDNSLSVSLLPPLTHSKEYWQERQIYLTSEYTKFYKMINNGYSQ